MVPTVSSNRGAGYSYYYPDVNHLPPPAANDAFMIHDGMA